MARLCCIWIQFIIVGWNWNLSCYTVILKTILQVSFLFLLFSSHFLLKNHNVDTRTAKDEYMLGGRKLPKLPVALSLLTTFLSGILMLGVPAEMFQRGAQIWMNFSIGAVSSLVTVLVFLPVFYKLKCTCLHEYFIHRYFIKQSKKPQI